MSICSLEGHSPKFPPSGRYWVAQTAVLIGKVELGERASVWYGAVLRGDNEPLVVGDDSNVQDNCVLHTDPGFPVTIGTGCTIGHKVMLHGCTIGDNTLIGIGASVLNGALIGENCIIGAHALIPEGKVIAPNSLVIGAPGRVMRELKREEIEKLRESAQIYVRNWQRFAKSLTPMDRP